MNWSGANWTNSASGLTGDNIISSKDTALIFSTTISSSNQDLSDLIINSMSFQSGSTFMVLSGMPIQFQKNSNGILPSLTNTSESIVYIHNDLVLNDTLTVQADQSDIADLRMVLHGAISGSGGIVLKPTEYIQIDGVQKTYTGETTIDGGRVEIYTDGTELLNGEISYAWATPAFNINGSSMLVINKFDVGETGSTTSFNFDSVGGGKMGSADIFNLRGNFAINTNGGSQNRILKTMNGEFEFKNSATLTFDVAAGTDPTSDLKIETSIIGSAGQIVKSGNGTLELTNANTYGAGTTVSAGTLLVSNRSGSATGTGTVTVQSGATLKSAAATVTGSPGLITGAVTIESGGTISPGLSATETGTLTLSGGLTLNPGSTAIFHLNSDTAGLGYSQIRASGSTLNLDGSNLVVNLGEGYAPAPEDFFQIMSGDPGTSRFAIPTDGFMTSDSLYYFDVDYSSSVVTLYNFTPVPEPATMMALGVAGLGLFHFVRRRRDGSRPSVSLAV
ncbi:MAG: autotransporter-associated beta strand repeat-containing protein [Gemmataceae bacterium]